MKNNLHGKQRYILEEGFEFILHLLSRQICTHLDTLRAYSLLQLLP